MVKDIVKANETVKPNDREMAVLKEHFADCFNVDGTFDLGKFQARLGEGLAVSNESYELNFFGKNYARLLTAVDTTTVVVPDEEHNAQPENAKSENVYISGDNLDALKQLLKSYARQVKCIYIDPPYNTGSDGFVYNDKFNFSPTEIAEKLNLSDEQAERILQFAKRGSASHSAWLMFMYPRLQLARDLLAKEGVIFISIDDNEQANLKLLCDEIFGEENFLSNIVWVKRYTRSNNSKTFSTLTEPILCYRRSGVLEEIKEPRNEKADSTYSNPDNDPRGVWTSVSCVNPATKEQRPNLSYDMVNPHTGAVVSHPTNAWKFEKSKYELYVKENRLYWGAKGENQYPRFKKFLSEMEGGMVPVDLWNYDDAGTTDEASKSLEELMGAKVFDFPKPIKLIQKAIRLVPDEEFIVVDFFSGSATTAEAVLSQNLDGKKRKFILVQLQEKCQEGSPAATAGYKTIDEIGQARIKKAAAKIAAENPLLAKTMDLGFKHYTLKEPTGEQLEKIETFNPDEPILLASDDVLKEFGLPTVLATWLVRDGYGLTATPTKVELDGYTAWWMKNHLYFIEAGDQGLTEDGIVQLMEKYETDASFNPANVVIFGYGGLSWTMRENLEKNLQKLQPDNNAAGAKKLAITIDVRY